MDFWSSFKQISMDAAYFYQCLACGAVVNDWSQHISWHEKIEGKIA